MLLKTVNLTLIYNKVGPGLVRKSGSVQPCPMRRLYIRYRQDIFKHKNKYLRKLILLSPHMLLQKMNNRYINSVIPCSNPFIKFVCVLCTFFIRFQTVTLYFFTTLEIKKISRILCHKKKWYYPSNILNPNK